MVLCGSGSATPVSPAEMQQHKSVERMLEEMNQADQQQIKLLLLGAGGCGKSTIFKQMKMMQPSGFGDDELQHFKKSIHRNCVEIFVNMLNYIEKTLREENPEESKIADELTETVDYLMETVQPALHNFVLTADLVPKLRALWQDPGIQFCYSKKGNFDFIENADYFIENMERMGQANYKPSEEDILRTRTKTVGIVEKQFEMKGVKFSMVDVGGQRSERRKWIHVFDNATMVIFVASLSEYDQVLAEQQDMNRMQESLNLFQDIASSRYFRKKPFTIFFNKDDLFREKVKKVELGKFFPEYQGGADYEAAKRYIIDMYLKLDPNKQRSIKIHVTNATDTKNMRVVFESVRATLVEDMMSAQGMMML